MPDQKTKINASYLIVFDGIKHRYLREGELVYQGQDIIYVGKHFPGEVDHTIDASGKIVSPGLINTHTHLSQSPLDRSFFEDRGNPQFYFSSLYENITAREKAMTREMYRACYAYSLAEILRSGSTTVVELGPYCEDLASLVPEFGIRVYLAQKYRSGEWYTPDGKQVLYKWFDDLGQNAMEKALSLIERYDGSCDGLIRGMLCPQQVDTCTEDLLLRSKKEAERLRVPVTTHASQAVIEFNEMLRRHGKTPIAWLRDIGFLGNNVILGHAIIIGGMSWTNYPPGDLQILSESGCSVAHAPWVFARRGQIMESFHRYQKAGINMSLATDTSPQSMIHAMRWAMVLSKIAERNTLSTTAADVFNAATLGGAQALGREDLGRLSVGAKADILIFSGQTTNMVPYRDPVKNIVFHAESEDIETVIINGKTVVDRGKVIGQDELRINQRIQEAGVKMWGDMPFHDWAHRHVDEMSPLTFAPWEDD